MPIAIKDQGHGNVVEIAPSLLAEGSGTILLQGDNNRVVIGAPAYRVGISFHLVGNATVQIGENLTAHQLFIYASAGTYVQVGRTVGFNGAVRLLLHEPGSITIGDGCLIAGGVDITLSDMHSVVDVTTGKRVNPAKDVKIGERVWIAERSMILKGVEIGDGAIVGAASVVTRSVPARCAAAGNPARVVRRDVTWNFALL